MNRNSPMALGSDLSEVSGRRSLILMALGAILGLMLAGYSLFTARGTSTLYVPPEDVAIVNQQPISRVDFVAQLQALYGVDLNDSTPEQRNKVLDDMIREELFVQRGKELDVAVNDPEVRSAMVNAVELEIAADAITSQPDDATLQVFYQSHKASYASEGTMTVYNYVSDKPSPGALLEAKAGLRQGPLSTDSQIRSNFQAVRNPPEEEFYFAAKIHLGDPLFDAARELTDGQVSAPIEMSDGTHLLLMIRNIRPVPQSFAAARDHVLADFRKTAIARLRTGDEAYLRKRAIILIADDMR